VPLSGLPQSIFSFAFGPSGPYLGKAGSLPSTSSVLGLYSQALPAHTFIDSISKGIFFIGDRFRLEDNLVMAAMRASATPVYPDDTLREGDLIDYITGNDPNLTYVRIIGIGGQGQVHIVLPYVKPPLTSSYKTTKLAWYV
jgi:hypothetical protein